MEELTIETPDPESSNNDVDVSPDDAWPDIESALPESEEDPYAGEPEPDENDGEDAASFEDVESDTDEGAESDTDEGTGSDSVPGEETGNSEPYPEKPERPVSDSETVSGNSADYQYGSGADASTHAAYESDSTDSLLLVETMERQNDILFAGFAGTLFILGIILGVLVIHGFRLRRV